MQSDINRGIFAGSVYAYPKYLIEVLFAEVSCSEVFNGSGVGTQREPLCGTLV